MKRALPLVLVLVLLTGATTPRPGPADSHLQSIKFNADEVVEIRGALGWQVMLEFGADERIENVSIGDALAWQVTPNRRARNLFLKPLMKNASTNMTVVTDHRQYSFLLETGPRSALTPWVVRFDYPREIVAAIEEPPPPPPPVLNFAYSSRGDATLIPARVWDDGQMTYFQFSEGTPIPAIFAGSGKDETLTNSIMRGRVVVVQQLSSSFTIRSGDQVATIVQGLGKKG
ncbi:MAG: TrbG/VirB9 family P-type conjugative transfer protein [Sphingomicrobium sp.]